MRRRLDVPRSVDAPVTPRHFDPVERRGRLLTLDALRGVAVMAILLANMPGFALPDPAYSNPIAWGGDRPIDIALWVFTGIDS